MTQDDDAIGMAFKANIALVRGVAKEETQGGAGSKFMGDCGGKVRVTFTAKDPKMLI